MPRCAGCVGACSCVIEGDITECVIITTEGDGSIADPLLISADLLFDPDTDDCINCGPQGVQLIIDPDPDNGLSCGPSGLFASTTPGGGVEVPFIVVADDGTGDFTSIKDAIEAVGAGFFPFAGYFHPTTIYVKEPRLSDGYDDSGRGRVLLPEDPSFDNMCNVAIWSSGRFQDNVYAAGGNIDYGQYTIWEFDGFATPSVQDYIVDITGMQLYGPNAGWFDDPAQVMLLSLNSCYVLNRGTIWSSNFANSDSDFDLRLTDTDFNLDLFPVAGNPGGARVAASAYRSNVSIGAGSTHTNVQHITLKDCRIRSLDPGTVFNGADYGLKVQWTGCTFTDGSTASAGASVTFEDFSLVDFSNNIAERNSNYPNNSTPNVTVRAGAFGGLGSVAKITDNDMVQSLVTVDNGTGQLDVILSGTYRKAMIAANNVQANLMLTLDAASSATALSVTGDCNMITAALRNGSGTLNTGVNVSGDDNIIFATCVDSFATPTVDTGTDNHINDFGGGGSGGAPKEGTFYVAASDASAASIAMADFVCDGTADEVEVQAAVNAAIAQNNGEVVLSEGHFFFANDVTISLSSYINSGRALEQGLTIKGSGLASNFTTASPTKLFRGLAVTSSFFTVTSGTGCTIQGISFYDAIGVHTSDKDPMIFFATSPANGPGVVRDCYFEQELDGFHSRAIETNEFARIHVIRCVFRRIGGACIYLTNPYDVLITGCYLYSSSSDAGAFGSNEYCVESIVDPGDGGEGADWPVRILGNSSDGNAAGTIHVSEGAQTIIEGNIFLYDTEPIILLEDCFETQIIGNQLGGGEQECIVLDSCTYCQINNNTLFESDTNGISLIGSNDCQINDNQIVVGGLALTNTYSGILIDSDSNTNMVVGNQIRSTDFQYGIRVNNANCDDNYITSNDLLNSAVTASFSDAGTGTITTAGNRV